MAQRPLLLSERGCYADCGPPLILLRLGNQRDRTQHSRAVNRPDRFESRDNYRIGQRLGRSSWRLDLPDRQTGEK
jgi:hypothetical protein